MSFAVCTLAAGCVAFAGAALPQNYAVHKQQGGHYVEYPTGGCYVAGFYMAETGRLARFGKLCGGSPVPATHQERAVLIEILREAAVIKEEE